MQRDNLDKQGMPGPNMSLAYRDDEVERQNFANEATLRYTTSLHAVHCTAVACHQARMLLACSTGLPDS